VEENKIIEAQLIAKLVAKDCADIAKQFANNPALEKYDFYQAQKAMAGYIEKAIQDKYSLTAST